MYKWLSAGVIDVGSIPRGNLGWSIRGAHQDEGADLDAFVTSVGHAAQLGPCAVGFEAPVFVPVRESAQLLACARRNERMAWSATPGAHALSTAIVVMHYVLRELKRILPESSSATLDWNVPPADARTILLFEAYVAGQGANRGSGRHIDDARRAANAFLELNDRQPIASRIGEGEQCFSIIGSVMLSTDWSRDASITSRRCLVIEVPTGARGRLEG